MLNLGQGFFVYSNPLIKRTEPPNYLRSHFQCHYDTSQAFVKYKCWLYDDCDWLRRVLQAPNNGPFRFPIGDVMFYLNPILFWWYIQDVDELANSERIVLWWSIRTFPGGTCHGFFFMRQNVYRSFWLFFFTKEWADNIETDTNLCPKYTVQI